MVKQSFFGLPGQYGRRVTRANVVPNSNPLGIKRFVPGISISFKYECYIIMQIQYTKNLNPGRFELGATSSCIRMASDGFGIQTHDLRDAGASLYQVILLGSCIPVKGFDE